MIKSILFLLLITFTFSAAAQEISIGQKVEVNYNGHWYKSTILNIDGDKYKVHYEGYPASDDVWVLRSYIRIVDAAGQQPKVTCSFDPPPGAFNNRSAASAALFKKKIYDWYGASINKSGISAPSAIGLLFTSFTMQPAYKNVVVVDAAARANRKHNGAPTNALIYTAKTNYIVCERYASGDSQKQTWARFSLFKDKSGEWTCTKDL